VSEQTPVVLHSNEDTPPRAMLRARSDLIVAHGECAAELAAKRRERDQLNAAIKQLVADELLLRRAARVFDQDHS
jgi:hypothetical protein